MTDRKWGAAVVDGAENLTGALDSDRADAELDDPFTAFVSPRATRPRSGARRPRRPATSASTRAGTPDIAPAHTDGPGDQKVNVSEEVAAARTPAAGDETAVDQPADDQPAADQLAADQLAADHESYGPLPTVQPSVQSAAASLGRTRHRSTRPVVLQMPVPVVKTTNDYARAHNVTKAEVVIHAVETSKDMFDTMFPTDFPEGTGSSLFAPRQVRRVRRVGEPLAQMQVQLLPAELAVLDRLVEQHRAPSRSQLVSKCLRAFLGLPDAPK